jgi:hypothetical protein
MNDVSRQVRALEPLDVPHDHLTQLELRIARRADELARTHDQDRARDFWLDAEREVIGRELVNVTDK